MNTINDLYRYRQGTSPSACPPAPVRCSTCGMLECLCRPRFFAGQILTADDLNRLDAYIRGKQRLHNRQLHGWGVVNGLEVTCNPCGDGVAVSCGYALSPCGDDIVVCEAVSVDICALIKRCCDAERKWQMCDPPRSPSANHCPDGPQDWILAIRYAESPARGVKPLRPGSSGGQDSSGCGCECGANASGGGCGCGGGSGAKAGCSCTSGTAQSACGTAQPARPRGAPAQCEPTVVCEGFAFEVYRLPVDKHGNAADATNHVSSPYAAASDSEIYRRFKCCTELLIEQMPAMPGQFDAATMEQDPHAWYKWVAQLRTILLRYFNTHGGYHCALLRRLSAIELPAETANITSTSFAARQLLLLWFDALIECLCSALLPPCPAPSDDKRVPLAVIHVGGNPCRVESICNWTTHRKFAANFPALQYWLALLPFGSLLRKLLEELCCGGERLLPGWGGKTNVEPMMYGATDTMAENAGTHAESTAGGFGAATALLNPVMPQPERVQSIAAIAAGAIGRASQTLDFQTLIESLLLPAAKQNDGHLSAAEIGNLPQFLMANQLLRPLAADLAQPLMGMAMSFAGAGSGAGVRAEAGTAENIAALEREMASLRASVQAQADEIAKLKSRKRPGSPS